MVSALMLRRLDSMIDSQRIASPHAADVVDDEYPWARAATGKSLPRSESLKKNSFFEVVWKNCQKHRNGEEGVYPSRHACQILLAFSRVFSRAHIRTR